MLLLPAVGAWAMPAEMDEGSPVPCVILEKFAGPVQILDSSRTHLLSSEPRTGIPCGGWVSVEKGWAELKHRDGYRIHLGPQTFVQFTENNTDGKRAGDSLVLYRGEIFAQASGGEGEFRAITANARARVNRGSLLLIFNHETEETQMVSLDNTSWLENRFKPDARIQVAAGEASTLNFRLMRVVPTSPRAVALADLKPKLFDLHVGDFDQSRSIRWARVRQDRKFASTFEAAEGARAPASASRPGGALKTKRRAWTADEGAWASGFRDEHVEDAAVPPEEARENAKLRSHFVNRMVAGQKEGERVLFPDRFSGVAQKGAAPVQIVQDPGRKHLKKAKKEEEREKRKLMEELSRIRMD